MGICPQHCPAPRGSLLKAVTIAAGVVLGLVVVRLAASVAEAVALSVLGLCAAGVPAVAYLVVHGRVRQPVTVPVQAALPQGTQLAIAAHRTVPGEIIAATTTPRPRTRAATPGR